MQAQHTTETATKTTLDGSAKGLKTAKGKAEAGKSSPPAQAHTPAPPESGGDAAVKTVKAGKREFVIEVVSSIPEDALKRAPSALALPFKDWFDQMPHNGHIFLPDSFWTERGTAADKLDKKYVSGKVRSAFNVWKDGKPQHKDTHSLIIVERQKGQPRDANRTYEEHGFSLYMQIAKATEGGS